MGNTTHDAKAIAAGRYGLSPFFYTGINDNPLDAALLLDRQGIAVRSGNHCAQPLMKAMGVEYALRISPAFYNTAEEIDRFAAALRNVISQLSDMEP